MILEDIVDTDRHPITRTDFAAKSATMLDRDGVLVLADFIRPAALDVILSESAAKQDQAYFCTQKHSVYLSPHDPAFPDEHPANRQVTSSKGCICDDEIAADSPLRRLYHDPQFQAFVAQVTGQQAVHPYADPLSSINIHYANRGQELGWHFDNSSFAITLLIQKPDAGSAFEYIKNLRDADAGQMNYDGVAALLDGQVQPDVLTMEPGTLVLFRGRNAAHRVAPNDSDTTRMLAVLAYNAQAGIALSENARKTFYGRLN